MSENDHEPQIAVNSRGKAVVVWTQSGGTGSVTQAALRLVGIGWQKAVSISEAGLAASAPHVAINADGETLAIWRSESRHEEEPAVGSMLGATRPPDGPWQAPGDLTGAGFNVESLERGGPQIFLDRAGEALTLWAGVEEAASIWIESAARTPSDEWKPTVRLTRQRTHSISLGVDGAGEAVAIWEEGPSGPAVAAFRPSGGE